MYLKLMSCDDAADHDSRKRFQLFDEVSSVEFERYWDSTWDNIAKDRPRDARYTYPAVRVTFKDGTVETICMQGNAYVLSDSGKTISSYAYEELPRSIEPQLDKTEGE